MAKMDMLTEMIFLSLDGQIPVKVFEQWLYKQEHLLDRMDEPFIAELFFFAYNSADAAYQFEKQFMPCFDKGQFLLWKVKTNLRSLTEDTPMRDRILYEFRRLTFDEGFGFLYAIGEYEFEFDEHGYRFRSKEDALEQLRIDAQELLDEIVRQEKSITKFTLDMFRKEP